MGIGFDPLFIIYFCVVSIDLVAPCNYVREVLSMKSYLSQGFDLSWVWDGLGLGQHDGSMFYIWACKPMFINDGTHGRILILGFMVGFIRILNSVRLISQSHFHIAECSKLNLCRGLSPKSWWSFLICRKCEYFSSVFLCQICPRPFPKLSI